MSRDEDGIKKGTLYIVSTPIGNLKDITLRALEVLQEVDLIACEDTRHTRKLLSRFGIKGKKLVSYYQHNQLQRTGELIKALREGKAVALVCDAGTPGISDPGWILIKEAIEAGVKVVPVPGACALVAGLVVSGLTTDEFTFIGFLSSKRGRRKQQLRELACEQRTLVFYESPHRLIETLEDMLEIFGDRQACVARELTKIFEEALRGRMSDILEYFREREVKGEIVIVIEGASEGKAEVDVKAELKKLLDKGFSMRDAVKAVAEKFGLPKRVVYKEGVEMEDV